MKVESAFGKFTLPRTKSNTDNIYTHPCRWRKSTGRPCNLRRYLFYRATKHFDFSKYGRKPTEWTDT